jgi:Mg2+ and Co2+ transporter CorA
MALIADTERQIEEEMAKRNEDDNMLGEDGMDRKTLLEFHETLLKDMESLDKELSLYSENDPAEVLRKVEDIQKFKNSAIRWTDNIESLESFIVSLVGDRAQAANVMQAACGDEYIVGEGLREL